MDEIMQKLLESELLSEETKEEVKSYIEKLVEDTKQQVRENTILEVRTELAEQWVTERDALIEKIDAFFEHRLEEELAELRSDIDRFRDLEAEYAEKLVEEKQELAKNVQADLDELVDKIDSFFEVRLAEEMEELREDLEAARENQFGRTIFEAFVSEYGKHFIDEGSIQGKLNVVESKLQDAQRKISELETTKATMLREKKMEEVLAPLVGSKREQMSFILQNVETQKLQEAYNLFIGRVLKEGTTNASAPIVEPKQEKTDDVKVITEEVTSKTTVITGNDQPQGDDTKKAELRKALRLAGVTS